MNDKVPEVFPGVAVPQPGRPILEYKLNGPCFNEEEFKYYEQLGTGGDATVDRADNIILGMCAVKKMAFAKTSLGEGASEKEFTANCRSFLEETQALKVCDDAKREFVTIHKVSHHANIVDFRGYLTRRKETPTLGPFTLFTGLIFEFMAGGTLENMISKTPDILEYDRILDYSIGIARALTFLHDKLNIIHRHIHPSNIFLTVDLSVAKLGDFGYAREDDTLWKTAKKGSIKYMAPEVIHEEGAYGFKSEVWSFSMLVYAMLVKREPSIEENGQEVTNSRRLRILLNEGIRPRFDTIHKDNFPLMVGLIENGWKKTPEERPEMIEMLQALVAMKKKGR